MSLVIYVSIEVKCHMQIDSLIKFGTYSNFGIKKATTNLSSALRMLDSKFLEVGC